MTPTFVKLTVSKKWTNNHTKINTPKCSILKTVPEQVTREASPHWEATESFFVEVCRKIGTIHILFVHSPPPRPHHTPVLPQPTFQAMLGFTEGNLVSPFSPHCSGRHRDRRVSPSRSRWKCRNMILISYSRHADIYKWFGGTSPFLASERGKLLPTQTPHFHLHHWRDLAPVASASLGVS